MSDNDSGSEVSEQDPTYTITFRDAPEAVDQYLRRDGFAVAKFLNGDCYEGEYKANKRHGQGKYSFANGASYEGGYEEGVKHGLGKLVLPDKSVYEGSFVRDKREGSGMYTYHNGDKYVGEWRNNQKHGNGRYIYSNGTEFTGLWSGGQLKSGRWTNPNNANPAQYFGQFRNNQPQGPGVFLLNHGNKQAGQYKQGQFFLESIASQANSASAQHSITATALLSASGSVVPAPSSTSQPSPFTLACRAVDKSVLKADQFEGIYRLRKEVEDCPNFRRVGGEQSQWNLWCSGQAGVAGLKASIEKITDGGFESILFISLRAEPVIFINSAPFAPRDKHEINRNFAFLGLSQQELNDLESRLAGKLREDIAANGNYFQFLRDTYAELENDRKNLSLEENITDLSQIQAQHALFAQLQEEEGLDISFLRITIDEERSPSLLAFDFFVEKLLNFDNSSTAVLLSDQFGRGKASTGAVIAQLIIESGVEAATEAEAEERRREEEEIRRAEQREAEEEEKLAREQQEEDEEEAEEKEENSEEEEETDRKYSTNHKVSVERDDEEEQQENTAKSPESKGETAEETKESGTDTPAVAESTGVKGAETAAAAAAAEELLPEGDAEPANYKQGQYAVIQQLIALLPAGEAIKATVDRAIDRTAAMINLREVILHQKELFEREESPDRKEIWLAAAQNHLERYFFLIAFYSYLKQQRYKGEKGLKKPQEDEEQENQNNNDESGAQQAGGFALSFQQWVAENNNLFAILGNRSAGALKDFNWL
jgi:radial spoke head protein 1